MYGRYVNSSITYILVSVCPADGIISHCPIWVDTIKKWISIEIRRVSVDWYKAAYVVDILSWRNFRLPKGSRIPRPPATWLKEAVSIWNPFENLSRRSLLRLWQTADFHDATHIVHRCFTYLRDSSLNSGQFDQSWKRIKAVCVWFPTSTFKLKVELNGSRYALFADGIAVWDPVSNSTHRQWSKLEWGHLDWPHQERCPQFWGDVDGAQKCAPWFNSGLSPQVEMCLTDLMTGIKVRS